MFCFVGLTPGTLLVSCPRPQCARGKGSGNIVHNELYQAQECGASNQIRSPGRYVMCYCTWTHKICLVFTVKVKWMPSLTDLVRPIGNTPCGAQCTITVSTMTAADLSLVFLVLSILVFTVKVEWMPSLMDLVRPIESSE